MVIIYDVSFLASLMEITRCVNFNTTVTQNFFLEDAFFFRIILS